MCVMRFINSMIVSVCLAIRVVSEMTYYVSSGTLNSTNSTQLYVLFDINVW